MENYNVVIGDVKYYSEDDLRKALGIAEDSDIFQCIKYRNHQLETLRTELVEARRMYHNAIKERNKFGRRLMDIRKAAGMADDDASDLVEYIETLRNCAEKCEYVHNDLLKEVKKISVLRGNVDYFANLAQGRQTALSNLHDEIGKVYCEIFDCSNGDPEGTDEETLQDILTEYKRTLGLKDAAEEKAAKYKVRLNNAERQLRWTEEVSDNRLEKYEKLKSELDEMTKRYGGSVMTSGGLCEDLAREQEKVRRTEQKLAEIKDICER